MVLVMAVVAMANSCGAFPVGGDVPTTAIGSRGAQGNDSGFLCLFYYHSSPNRLARTDCFHFVEPFQWTLVHVHNPDKKYS